MPGRARSPILALLGCSLLAVAADARPPAGGAAEPTLEVRWILRTADLQDGRNNGFPARCGQPDESGPCAHRGVWCGTIDKDRHPRCAAPPAQLDFYVQSKRGKGPVATTTIPCPDGASGGTVTLRLPDAKGPYLVWAGFGAPDPDHSSSAWVDPFDRRAVVEVTVYACGCDWVRSGTNPTCGGAPK